MRVQAIQTTNSSPDFRARINHRILMGHINPYNEIDLNFLNRVNDSFEYEKKFYDKKYQHSRAYFHLDIIDKFEEMLKKIPDDSEFTIMNEPYSDQKIILKNGQPVAGPFHYYSSNDEMDVFAQFIFEEYPHEFVDIAIKNDYMSRMYFEKPSTHKQWERIGKSYLEKISNWWDKYYEEHLDFFKPQV